MTILPTGTAIDVTVTWLEMDTRPSFGWPSQPTGTPASLLCAETPPAWYFRALYDAVGEDHEWTDMHAMPPDDIAAWLADPDVQMWSLIRAGWPQGLFILDWRAEHVCNIAYFGIVAEALGQGWGKFLLRTAILTGWERPGVERMTLNTCTLDHPRALPLYQKHGFAPVRQSTRRHVLTRPRDTQRYPI